MTIAKAGEKVTCENGHHVCTLRKDINLGDMWVEDAFGEWAQPEPAMASPFPVKCTACGAYWITHEAICVNREWRTYLTTEGIKVEEFEPGAYSIRGTEIIWRKR